MSGNRAFLDRFLAEFDKAFEWRYKTQPGENDDQRNMFLQGWVIGFLRANDMSSLSDAPGDLGGLRLTLARAMLRASMTEGAAQVTEREGGPYWQRMLAEVDAVVRVIEQLKQEGSSDE